MPINFKSFTVNLFLEFITNFCCSSSDEQVKVVKMKQVQKSFHLCIRNHRNHYSYSANTNTIVLNKLLVEEKLPPEESIVVEGPAKPTSS